MSRLVPLVGRLTNYLSDQDIANVREAMFCYFAATNGKCVKYTFDYQVLSQIFPYLKQISSDWEYLKPYRYSITPES